MKFSDSSNHMGKITGRPHGTNGHAFCAAVGTRPWIEGALHAQEHIRFRRRTDAVDYIGANLAGVER